MLTGPSDTHIAHKAIRLCEDLPRSENRVVPPIIGHCNRRTGGCDPRVVHQSSEKAARLGLVD
jgi:hypothetical protein